MSPIFASSSCLRFDYFVGDIKASLLPSRLLNFVMRGIIADQQLRKKVTGAATIVSRSNASSHKLAAASVPDAGPTFDSQYNRPADSRAASSPFRALPAPSGPAGAGAAPAKGSEAKPAPATASAGRGRGRGGARAR